MTTIARAQRVTRRVVLLLTPAAYSIATAAPAWAAVGGIGAALFLGVTDSSGVPIGAYGLSLNNGSLSDPSAAPDALTQHWLYSAFLAIIGLALWLRETVLSFEWLRIISTPFDFIGQQISALTLSPAVILAVGTVAAAVIAVTVVLGRLSRAAAQVGVAVVLVMMAVTLGHKPISDLVGPSGGLALGRDIGIDLSSQFSGKPSGGQQGIQDGTAELADHFARTPTLVWNWGADLDAAPYNCGRIWSAAINAGDIDKVKDAVKAGCPHGEELHKYAMTDSPSKNVIGFFAFGFAVAVLGVFGYLCVMIIILALSTLFWAIVAIVALILGAIPERDTQSLALKAAIDALFSFVGMIGYVAVFGITGNLTSAMFSMAGDDVVVAMPLVTLLLVALVLALRRVRSKLVSARERTVQAIASLTGRGQADRFNDPATVGGGAPSLLERLDPLTAVPHATHRVSSTAKSAAGTAAKIGVSAAAPEVAPFVGAADQLQSRVSAQNLRRNRRQAQSAAAGSDGNNNASPSSGIYDVAPIGREAPPLETHTDSSGPPAPPAAPANPSPPPRADQPSHPASTRSMLAAINAPPQTDPNRSRIPANAVSTYTTPEYSSPARPTVRPRFEREFPPGDPRNDVRMIATDRGFVQVPRVHPAILAVAHGQSQTPPMITDPDEMPEFYGDIRRELMGRPDKNR